MAGILLLTGLSISPGVERAGDSALDRPNAATARRANIPEMVEADGALRLDFGEEILVLPRGLQPSLLRTASGALLVQGQIPEKPLASSRMHYPWAMETRVSRDDGQSWLVLPRPTNENGINLEGGAIQLRDGALLALDTFISFLASGPMKGSDRSTLRPMTRTRSRDRRMSRSDCQVRTFIVPRTTAATRTMRSVCIAASWNSPAAIS